MLNNKGFTVIELIMSFVFTSILALSLFAVVLNYRNRQTDESIRADLLSFKSQLIIDVQKDIQMKGLHHIDYCEEENPVTHVMSRVGRCIVLHFNDNPSTSKEFRIKEETSQDLLEHPDGSSDKFYYSIPYIVYGGIRYDIPDAANVSVRSNFILEETTFADGLETNTPIYKIRVDLAHNDIDGDMDISIVCEGTKKIDNGATPYTQYSIGDRVTIQLNDTTQMKFVVIKSSSSSDSYLTLLYDDVYDSSTSSLLPTSISFNEDESAGNSYSVYSTIGGQVSRISNVWVNAKTVRLITFEEIEYILDLCPYYRNAIQKDGDAEPYIAISTSGPTANAPEWLVKSNNSTAIDYWTASARDYSKEHSKYGKRVWVVSNSNSRITDAAVNSSFALRPVIEVSKIYVTGA